RPRGRGRAHPRRRARRSRSARGSSARRASGSGRAARGSRARGGAARRRARRRSGRRGPAPPEAARWPPACQPHGRDAAARGGYPARPMPTLSYRDPRTDPAAWARELGISPEAGELSPATDVLDLHLASFIWTRILGYDLRKRHGYGPTGGRYLSMVDLPRVREARLTGGTWVITTNPLQPSSRRPL